MAHARRHVLHQADGVNPSTALLIFAVLQSTEVFQLWGLQNALTGDVGGVSPDHYRGHVYASAGKVLERADVTGNNVVTIASYELPETDIGMNGRCFVDHANRRLWVAYHSRTVGGDVNYNCGIGYYHLPADSGATFFEYVGSPDCTGATQGPQMSLYSAVAQSLWFEPRTRRLYWWSTGAVNYLPNGSERTGHAVVSIDVSDLTTAPEVYYQTSGGNGEIARAVTVMYLTGEGLGLRTRIFTATPSALYSGGHTYGDGSSERYTVSSRSYPGFRALCHDGSSYQRLVSTHDWYGSQGNQQQIRRGEDWMLWRRAIIANLTRPPQIRTLRLATHLLQLLSRTRHPAAHRRIRTPSLRARGRRFLHPQTLASLVRHALCSSTDRV